MDVTEKDQLIVRVRDGTKYCIQVFDRQTGDLINKISLLCDHFDVRLNKHPRYPDYVLEGCGQCKKIHAYNTHTAETFIVHKGSEIVRIFDGPAGSLLVVDKTVVRYISCIWRKTRLAEAQVIYTEEKFQSPGENKEALRLCYVECHDILIHTVKVTNEDKGYDINCFEMAK